MMSSAPELLRHAATLIEQRAASRDRPAERSMRSAVEAFNVLTGQAMTELQGWVFMAVLKMARAHAGGLNPDDYLDGAAYMALALEHALESLGSDFSHATDEGIPEAGVDPSVATKAACKLACRAKTRAGILQEWKGRELQ